MLDRSEYLKKLKERRSETRVYSKHQLVGLQIAELLDDKAHVALYMKLARDKDEETLLGLAKDVAERSEVTNKGAYFMKVIAKK